MPEDVKRKKPKYEAPTVVLLGGLAKGTGSCGPGSLANEGDCTSGSTAESYCTAGGGTGSACTAGTSAPSACTAGTGK